MGLENIKNLNELNQLLNNTAAVLKNTKAEGQNKVITVSSWGSRDFTLISSKDGEGPIHAKMSEIVSTFERLAKKEGDQDNHLIGNIHDRIFELNAEGETKLKNEKGRAAVLLRDIKTLSFITEFFFGSHSTKNDSIELKYLSTTPIQDKAIEILNKFDELNNTIDELTKNKGEPIQKTPDPVSQLLETHDYNDDIPDNEGYTPNEYDTDRSHDGIGIARNSKKEYSAQLLRDIFTENKYLNLENSENTKNAIRFIVLKNPEKALAIIEELKNNLDGMSQLPSNPKEFIQSLQDFLEVQEEEIYSTTKLPRPDVSDETNVFINLPAADPNNPIKNIKTQFGENFSIILDEKTKTPMLQFKFGSADERKAKNDLVESAIIAASEFSIYEKPEDDILPLSIAVNEEYTLNVPPHSSLLLSGVSREVFMEKMYQAMWEQSSTPEERSKILEEVIGNLPNKNIEDFFSQNKINLTDHLKTPLYSELAKKPELLSALWSHNLRRLISDNLEALKATKPNELVKKIVFLTIQNGTAENVMYLCRNINPKFLDSMLPIDSNDVTITGTPLGLTRLINDNEKRAILLSKGARIDSLSKEQMENKEVLKSSVTQFMNRLTKTTDATLQDIQIQDDGTIKIIFNKDQITQAKDFIWELQKFSINFIDDWNENTQTLTIPPQKVERFLNDGCGIPASLIVPTLNGNMNAAIKYLRSVGGETDTEIIKDSAGKAQIKFSYSTNQERINKQKLISNVINSQTANMSDRGTTTVESNKDNDILSYKFTFTLSNEDIMALAKNNQ